MNLSIALEIEKNQYLIRSFLDENTVENFTVSTGSEFDKLIPQQDFSLTSPNCGDSDELNFSEDQDIVNEQDFTEVRDVEEKQDLTENNKMDQTTVNSDNFEILKSVNLLIGDNFDLNFFTEMTLFSNATHLKLTEEMVKNLSFADAKLLYSKMNEESSLKHNIDLITKITDEGLRLSKVFMQNREVFILNLWKLLFKNLSAKKLSILFQNVESVESRKLICKKLNGPNLQLVTDCTESEEPLFQDLHHEFGRPLNFSNYNMKNGQLTLTITLKSTKIIVMAEVLNLTVLQKSTLTGILNSIAHFI